MSQKQVSVRQKNLLKKKVPSGYKLSEKYSLVIEEGKYFCDRKLK